MISNLLVSVLFHNDENHLNINPFGSPGVKFWGIFISPLFKKD